MTTTSLSFVSHRTAARTAQPVLARPNLLTLFGEALSAARAVQTSGAPHSVAVAARFAAQV